MCAIVGLKNGGLGARDAFLLYDCMSGRFYDCDDDGACPGWERWSIEVWSTVHLLVAFFMVGWCGDG